MKIMMIRHLQTPGNLKKCYIGRSDEPLAQEKIVEESRKRIQKKLKQLAEPEVIIASPMKRCVQTAALLFPSKIPLLCGKMRECDFGIFEGKNYEELKNCREYKEWLASDGTLPFPEGEDHEEFKKRCREGFDSMVSRLAGNECERAAMVVHGGTIMAVLSHYDINHTGFYSWQVENGGGFIVTVEAKDWLKGRKVLKEMERI